MEFGNTDANSKRVSPKDQNNLGLDNLGWAPAFANFKEILEQIKSEDEMIVYQGVMELTNQLSIAQENTLNNFSIDNFIPALMDILRRPPLTEISNEVGYYAVQSLTHLMDIFPSICNSIVNHKGPQAFVETIQRSLNFGFIDLSESCIKALEKISFENPYSVLVSGGVQVLLNMLDFFEQTTQKRIIQLAVNVSRHSQTLSDFQQYMEPIYPFLCMILQIRGESEHLIKQLENISTILVRMAESFYRIYNPTNNFTNISEMFNRMSDAGLIEAVLQATYEASLQLREASVSSAKLTFTNTTVSQMLRLLSMSSKHSAKIANQLTEFNVFRFLVSFFPPLECQHADIQRDYPFVTEAIALLDSLFPEKEDLASETEQCKKESENAKRALLLSDQEKIAFVAEKILPLIFAAYENNISGQLRLKILQVIDKLIALFNEELLNNFIQPYSFAKFIQSIFQTLHPYSIQICLQIIEKLVKSNPKSYTVPLIREGIFEFVQKINSPENFTLTIGLPYDQEIAQLSEEEDMLAKAQMLFGKIGEAKGSVESAKLKEALMDKHFQAIIAKIKGPESAASPIKSKATIHKAVVNLSQSLLSQYYENEDFMASINEFAQNEIGILQELRSLAGKIKDLALTDSFDITVNKQLIQGLTSLLTNQKSVLDFEFKESGILESLALYLCKSPTQANAILQEKQEKEEMKEQEVEKLKKAKDEQLQKQEAMCLWFRFSIFASLMLKKTNERVPLVELVKLCMEQLSGCEEQIFKTSRALLDPISQYGAGFLSRDPYAPFDLTASTNAFKQLTRRMRLNLVYKPEAAEEALTVISGKAEVASDAPKNRKHLIFRKRHLLYTEISEVLVSIEQCASLWLVEDFLRGRIKTHEDVKMLKAPQTLYQAAGKPTSKNAKAILEETNNKIREMLESEDRSKPDPEEFAEILQEEIMNAKELTEEDQTELLKHVEISTIQFMEELHSGEESLGEEGLEEHFLGDDDGEKPDNLLEVKLLEFHQTMDRVRKCLLEKREQLYQQQQLQLQQQQLQQPKPKEEKQMVLEKPKEELIDTSSKISTEKQELIDIDLEELLNLCGEDIEYEFFFEGNTVSVNSTVFEVLKKTVGDDPNKLSSSDSITIHYSIKQRQEEVNKMGSSSFLEAEKQGMSVRTSSIAYIFSELISKEFKIFGADRQEDTLSYVLSLLKVLHFICTKIELFSQGISLISLPEEQKVESFLSSNFELDRAIVASSIPSSLFYHSKIEAYFMRMLHDPYMIIGGQISEEIKIIFRKCPFLFPFLTRQLFFRVVSFSSSIDMSRSLLYLKKYLKGKGQALLAEDKNSVKISKQKVVVERAGVIEYGFQILKSFNKRSLLEIQFAGEEGTGLGPTMEFYLLLSEEVRKIQGMWRPMSDHSLFPAPLKAQNTEEAAKKYDLFKLIGAFVAKSIVDNRLIDLPFSSLFWACVFDQRPNLFDLEKLDGDLYKMIFELQKLAIKKQEIEQQENIDAECKQRKISTLRITDGTKVDDLSLYFNLPGHSEIELKPNGKDLQLTNQNVQEYVDLVMDFFFNETIKVQVSGFRKGFNTIFPVDSLSCFNASELEEMICGLQKDEEWGDSLEQNIVPAHGYHQKSIEFQHFLQYMKNLKVDERRNFLIFITGSPRLPMGGFASLDPKLTVVLKKANYGQFADDFLPSVMTCVNYLKLPNYSSYEIMKIQFEKAINEGQKSFTLS